MFRGSAGRFLPCERAFARGRTDSENAVREIAIEGVAVFAMKDGGGSSNRAYQADVLFGFEIFPNIWLL